MEQKAVLVQSPGTSFRWRGFSHLDATPSSDKRWLTARIIFPFLITAPSKRWPPSKTVSLLIMSVGKLTRFFSLSASPSAL